MKIENVWPGCTIKIIPDVGTKWVTIGTCLWTPTAIGKFFEEHNLKSAWVFYPGGKEYVSI